MIIANRSQTAVCLMRFSPKGLPEKDRFPDATEMNKMEKQNRIE